MSPIDQFTKSCEKIDQVAALSGSAKAEELGLAILRGDPILSRIPQAIKNVRPEWIFSPVAEVSSLDLCVQALQRDGVSHTVLLYIRALAVVLGFNGVLTEEIDIQQSQEVDAIYNQSPNTVVRIANHTRHPSETFIAWDRFKGQETRITHLHPYTFVTAVYRGLAIPQLTSTSVVGHANADIVDMLVEFLQFVQAADNEVLTCSSVMRIVLHYLNISTVPVLKALPEVASIARASVAKAAAVVS